MRHTLLSTRRSIVVLTCLALAMIALSGRQPAAHSQQPSAQQPAVPDYVSFTRRIPNGLVNVGALELPDAFVRRVADRSLRSHFRMLYRQVAAVEPASAETEERDGDAPANAAVHVVDGSIPQDVMARWSEVLNRNEVAELRGFRAPLEAGTVTWKMGAPTREDDPAGRSAALMVAESLASQGLVRTTLSAIRTQSVCTPGQPIDVNELAAIGLPVDLLAMYTAGGQPFLDRLNEWWLAGGRESDANALADRARLEFRATQPGFRVMAEDGSVGVSLVRMQLPNAAYATGQGDGSPIDVLRQLACAAHSWRVVTTVRDGDVDAITDMARAWPVDQAGGLTLVSSPVFGSQWAQDNGKAGTVASDEGGGSLVTLVPRVASVNEQMTKCVPADSLIMESLRGEIGAIAQSPLLFQGGNLMCVEMPRSGDRVLLVGEAEVYRNQALGLSERDVLSAFRHEFGVDRCVIMPAISFHIDMEFTIRRVGDELVAVVGDDVAAARIVLSASLQALAKAGVMDAQTVDPAVAELRAGKQRAALVAISRVIPAFISSEGRLHGALVEALRTSPVDVPDAAAGRMMHAIDLLTAVEAHQQGGSLSPGHAHERAYRESLLRRLDERAKLAEQLEGLGMRVVRVPNLGDEELGVNVINAVHVPGASYIPVSGGVFAGVDDAAIEAYRAAFGESIEIVPITTTFVQSKYGGVHCMVSVYPVIGE